MKRSVTKGGFLLRSNWLRLLVLFVVFGVVFAVYTHKQAGAAQRQAASAPKELLTEDNNYRGNVEMDSIFDFSVDNIDGENVNLKKYQNRVTLIVNGATI